jgi:hypothetical protein
MSLTVDPARIVAPQFFGQSGLFNPFFVNDTGVITFDMTATLAAGETITGIVDFDFEVAGPPANPPYVTDPDLPGRILATPQNTATQLLVELGNWQQGVTLIQYAANFVYTTTLGTRTVSGAVQVVSNPKFTPPPVMPGATVCAPRPWFW